LCYVLKLDSDANPGGGPLRGVLEHVASGEAITFQCGAALQAALIGHASGVQSQIISADEDAKDRR
jgi:hypothetical protein